MMERYNEHRCVKFMVVLSFVSPDEQSGYLKTEYVHCECKYEAAAKASAKFMGEDFPIRGVAVYECTLAY